MKKMKLFIISLLILCFSGCTQKENQVQIVYKDRLIKAPVYEFQIVDINGARIEIKSAWYQSPTMLIGVNGYKNGKPSYEIRLTSGDVANICGGYMKQEKEFYRTIIDGFYVQQILDYRKFTKEQNGND